MSDGAWWARLVSPDHSFGRGLLAARTRVDLVRWQPTSERERALKSAVSRLSPAYTMVAVPRLRQLAAHAYRLHEDGVEGALVECGTWRGGSLALVDWAFRSVGESRMLWGFDSFAGLPPPGDRDSAAAHRGFFPGWCAASTADVREAIHAVGGSPDRACLMSGWLDETLPQADTGPIAFLHIDVDWYESVRSVFTHLFDRVSARGIVSVDDYGRWSGCDRAVHDFLDSRGLSRGLLRRTGRHGAWFQRPS